MGNYVEIFDFVDELARAGLGHACVSPGARSTPLALALASHPGVRVWSHVDERSGSFFALGLAKASRSPVAVLCTSGTAAANFHPAVIEAAHARVPLVVLTADRPPELRGCGASQAIDQIKLYGDHVKWFVEVGEASAGERYFRALGARAVATAWETPAGPVHLNFPFREPLVPVARDSGATDNGATRRSDGRPYTRVHGSIACPSPATVAELALVFAEARRGLVVCGPLEAGHATVEAVKRLAALLGYPVLADATSQLRSGPDESGAVIDAYDVFLREPAFADAVAPEVVLRIGRQPTSKALLAFLARQTECRQVVIDPSGGWDDPSLVAEEIVWCDPESACRALAERLRGAPPLPDDAWLERWRGANRRARRALDGRLSELPELFEGRVFAELAAILPPGSSLYAGNSMAMRDLEVFWPAGGPEVRVLCNRGANGIDGFVSSALGAAASAGPLVAVTGDLGFYHDLNGLLAAKRYGVRATFVVLNNDGGGIFSYLPQAECGAAFNELFLTPHGLDFRGAVEMYGCRFRRVATGEEFRRSLAEALDAPVTTVIEVPIAHERSVALHREIWAAAGRAALEAGE